MNILALRCSTDGPSLTEKRRVSQQLAHVGEGGRVEADGVDAGVDLAHEFPLAFEHKSDVANTLAWTD